MRREDWPLQLAAAVEAAQNAPFQYGMHDCCAFAARAVRAMTGRDLMALFPAYVDEQGAQAVLDAHGGLEGIWTRCLGLPLANPRLAQRGDVMLVQAGRLLAAGILVDHKVAVPYELGGLAFVPPSLTPFHAWRVD